MLQKKYDKEEIYKILIKFNSDVKRNIEFPMLSTRSDKSASVALSIEAALSSNKNKSRSLFESNLNTFDLYSQYKSVIINKLPCNH